MLFPKYCLIVLCNLVLCYLCKGFSIPPVKLVAYEPAGFSASIKDEPDIKLFAFHAKVNEPIRGVLEPGTLSEDVRQSRGGYWTYYNPTVKLQEGDTIYYWVFVQHDQLGYRLDNQTWHVTKLRKYNEEGITGQGEDIVLEDRFDGKSLNQSVWLWEQYIPDGPDFEFVIYKKDPTVCYVNNGALHLKPKPCEHESDIKKDIDLTDGCTRSGTLCYNPFGRVFIQNPITSGRFVSIATFSFATVEINAKLPKGDWVYPQIYLENVENPAKKIWIAYSRGNRILRGGSSEIGSTLLFCGPVINAVEPERSKYLSSLKNNDPLYQEKRNYSLTWTSDHITLSVDGRQYGKIDGNRLFQTGFDRPQKMRLVLGVGVGGNNDFPNGFISGDYPKPWINKERLQVQKFYKAKDQWLKTWDDNTELLVDYVKITAL